MKTKYLLPLLAFLAPVTLFAQSGSTPPLHCPSDEITDSLIMHDPRWARSFFYMEQAIQAANALPEEERTNDIYVLPVVVHVIHEGEPYGVGSNITDEQIISAIEALNEDFRHVPGSNGDGAGVDVGIEFCLAARDPNGNPTTGIVRVNGSSVANYATMGIEASNGNGADEAAVKALSTWPRTSYVNIWIVNEIENNDAGSGIQGYAYFPVNSPLDGIVILHNAFGTVGNLKSYTDMNRTATHEVGHYLGLYHTFHDTSTCTSETNCTTQGDRVCDTPATILNSSCTSPACSGTQQVENYMDYTSETCQDMFSEGQKTRMRTTLETQRTSMLTSLGCMPVFDRDAGITAILEPYGQSCNTTYQPVVMLTNFGNLALTSVTINYNVDGVGSSTYAWTGNLASGAQVQVTLPTVTTGIGAHTLYAWTTNPNGQSDQNAGNNQSTGDFTVTTGSTLTLLVELDYFGTENTWQVTDDNDMVVASGGPYVNNQQGLDIYENLCLPDGCYTLTFFDTYGDGMGFTTGDFTLLDDNNNVLVFQSGNWGAISANPFCVTGSPAGNPPVAGFTIQDSTPCTTQQVDFTNTSTNTPTSYAWTFEGGNPATSTTASPQNVTWSAAGTYDVTLTVTNAYGSNTYTCANCITVAAPPSVTLTPSNPLCNTGSTGSITTTVTGGNSPYTYAWNTGASSANLNNVAAGTYTVTVTNQQGCSSSASATLTAPSAIAITGSVTQPGCGSTNGSISVSATGGTGSKTFTWNTGATGASISGLGAGTYTVTATDQNNCTATQSFTLSSSSGPVVNLTTTNPSCNGGSNGSISTTVTGGNSPYTYSWSTGASSSGISNLSAGSYSVTVTNSLGCSSTVSATLTAPSAIAISGTTNHPDCNGSNDGSITVSATGGTGNKTFTWNTGATGATISGLDGGTYTVTATDQNNCSVTQSYTLTEPTAVNANLTSANAGCSGNTGSASVNPTGGTSPYTISWSTGASGNSVSNLGAGTYSVSVSDANGCTDVESFTITASAGLTLTMNLNPVECFGTNTGGGSVSVSGGTAPYTYLWSTFNTGPSISNRPAGTYSVTVTDSQGCTATGTLVVPNPLDLVMAISSENLSCAGSGDGSITAVASGGTGSIAYMWNTGATSPSISNLSAGTYSVTATDANGCTETQTVTISQPAPLAANLSDFDISCGDTFGSATVAPSGGTAPYSISWSNGASGSSATNLSNGNYSVTVEDAQGCEVTSSFAITTSTGLSIVLDADNITCNGLQNGMITAQVAGGVGPYTYAWNTGQSGATLSGLSPGNYSVTVTDAEGCNGTASVSLSQPSTLQLAVFKSDITCFGLADGSATATATGGTGSYTFTWSNGETGNLNFDLSAGSYSVTVTDQNGCTDTESFVIAQPSQLVATTSLITPESCSGNDGSAVANTLGGTGNYIYLWSNGSTDAVLENVSSGTYTVTIADANGCSTSAELFVPIDCEITIDPTQVSPEDCGIETYVLTSEISCEEVPGASLYQWRFNNTSGATIDEVTTSTATLSLSNVSGLQTGVIYLVAVRAYVDGAWGTYDTDCTIGLDDNPLTTQLTDADCGSVITEWGAIIYADAIPGAMNYEWLFIAEGFEWTSFTDNNEFVLEESMQFQAGETYNVLVRCALGGGQVTMWGELCTITFGSEVSEPVVIDERPEGELTIFPNPCDGSTVVFNFSNLPIGSSVKDIMIFGINGQLIENISFPVMPSTKIRIEYNFDNRLASGMYFIRYTLNEQPREEKLIVR